MYKNPTNFTIIISILLTIILSGFFQLFTEVKNKIKMMNEDKKESYKQIKKADNKNKKLV
jgi:hypothetical protein